MSGAIEEHGTFPSGAGRAETQQLKTAGNMKPTLLSSTPASDCPSAYRLAPNHMSGECRSGIINDAVWHIRKVDSIHI
jgi:hypothetical protein